LREERDAAAALERLIPLLRALRPGSNGGDGAATVELQSYYDRLARDAAAALNVATTGSSAAPANAAAAPATAPAIDGAALPGQAAAVPADGAALDLPLFLEVLSCCGHDGWLRTGKGPDAAGDSASGDSPRSDAASPRSAGAATPRSAGAASPRVPSGVGASPRNASWVNSAAAAAFAAGGAAAATPDGVLRRTSGAAGSGSGGAAALCPPQHTFVVVRAPGQAGSDGDGAASVAADVAEYQQSPMFVVDPSFRERFSIASIAAASPVYRALVAALPAVVIGTAEGLEPLVSFMCEQVRRAPLSRFRLGWF
jgi:hypothetical protein